MPSRNDQKRTEAALREFGMAFPEAYEEFPWGHRAIKVNGKTFVFLSIDDNRLSLSAKLPVSNLTALMLPFAEPTHYGLGKSGWVTAGFNLDAAVPVELLCGWMEESYRAIAPKALVALLPAAAPPAKRPKPRRPSRAKPARR
ncbi:MAG TPA: MmcQ/YjbR family DNA-binding protein [Patescibacteria group bacterium]|jgi:predicted DNA-binding protein (MmcQ/YjbR family)|nr:MmcQ/YjbR family DNA-binding protein [Patescibacteria group bacterium]